MKKLLKTLLLIIITIPIVYVLMFFIQNYFIKQSFESEYISSNQSYIIETQLLKCNLNIFQPEFVRITEFEDRAEKRLSFYRPSNIFSQTKKEWKNSRIGGTTIKNTTFPELVKMVKEDCSQFQENYDNPLVDEGGIDWGYREADPPEPPKTEDEIENDKHVEMDNAINNVLGFVDNMLTNLQRDKFIEFYGDIHSMTNEEIYQIYLQLMESGEMMVDESLHEFFYNEYGMKYVEYE